MKAAEASALGLGFGPKFRGLVKRLQEEDSYTDVQATILALTIVFGPEIGILYALIDAYHLDMLLDRPKEVTE